MVQNIPKIVFQSLSLGFPRNLGVGLKIMGAKMDAITSMRQYQNLPNRPLPALSNSMRIGIYVLTTILGGCGFAGGQDLLTIPIFIVIAVRTAIWDGILTYGLRPSRGIAPATRRSGGVSATTSTTARRVALRPRGITISHSTQNNAKGD